jgi:hypothetical protein
MRKSSGGGATLSRRAVIGATTAAPVIGAGPLASNDTVAHCADWIALDLEIDRLTVRWSNLEAVLVRGYGWFSLTSVARRTLPAAAELFEIEDRLEILEQRRERSLEQLSHLPANTLHGVATKLVIAARLLEREEHPAQPFVASAVRELSDMCCAGCRAAYIPAGIATLRW